MFAALALTAVVAAAEPGDPPFCPISTSVTALDGGRTYAIRLRSLEPGTATGIVALYAGDRRYDVPFADLDFEDGAPGEATRPIVVRFDAPVRIEEAAVRRLTTEPCTTVYGGWSAATAAPPLNAANVRKTWPWDVGEAHADADFAARARKLKPIAAPPPAADPRTCTTPDAAPELVSARGPSLPSFWGMTHPGVISVVGIDIVVGPNGLAIARRIRYPSGTPEVDEAGMSRAANATFTPATFRCVPAFGQYLLGIDLAR